jgi:hypothetical protein
VLSIIGNTIMSVFTFDSTSPLTFSSFSSGKEQQQQQQPPSSSSGSANGYMGPPTSSTTVTDPPPPPSFISWTTSYDPSRCFMRTFSSAVAFYFLFFAGAAIILWIVVLMAIPETRSIFAIFALFSNNYH